MPPKVIDALTHAPTAYGTNSLLSKVADINDYGYVLALDDAKHVVGIVTSADLASQFAERVEPFMLVEEVEQRLRGIVDGALADGAITLARMREALAVKQELFLTWVFEVKEFRNNLMHFSPARSPRAAWSSCRVSSTCSGRWSPAPENYAEICSTHSFDGRVRTVGEARQAGLSPLLRFVFPEAEVRLAGEGQPGAAEQTLPPGRRVRP